MTVGSSQAGDKLQRVGAAASEVRERMCAAEAREHERGERMAPVAALQATLEKMQMGVEPQASGTSL